MSNIACNTYTGDGSAQNISLGFEPSYVLVWNATDGDAKWEWFRGLGEGDALATANADTAQQSLISADGIDYYAGDGDNPKGFTVGTALSESGKTFRYIAFGKDPYPN